MLDPIREEKWEDLKKGCRELGVPAPPEVHIGIELFDKNKKKIYDDIQRGNSWTRNYYNYVFAALAEAGGGGSNNFGAGYMSVKRSTATLDYSATYTGTKGQAQGNNFFTNTSGSSTFGIMVGTSAAAFDEDHYTLQGLISHGLASGNLMYISMSTPPQAYAGTTWTVTQRRMFENLSGGSITVAETGLYASLGIFNASVYYYLIERNILDSSIAVADMESLKITYTFSMNFTAIDP